MGGSAVVRETIKIPAEISKLIPHDCLRIKLRTKAQCLKSLATPEFPAEQRKRAKHQYVSKEDKENPVMFKTLTRLLFGGEEETPEACQKSGDMVEEGWLVVTHQEAETAENQNSQAYSQQLNSAPHGDTIANIETSTSASDPEPAVQTSSTSSPAIATAFSQPKALAEATQSACIQKAKAWADRHHVSRNAILRQNRVRQGVLHPSFHLQQPGHRNLSH